MTMLTHSEETAPSPGGGPTVTRLHRKKARQKTFSGVLAYVLVGVICLTTIFPFFWMVSTSSNPNQK